jgi:transposase
MKRYKESGEIKEKPRSGRPALISITDSDHNIITKEINQRRNGNWQAHSAGSRR